MILHLYDAGALVAADRRDQRMLIRHRGILASGQTPLVPAGVLGQVWRDGARQVQLARLVKGCKVLPLTEELARAAGELCGRAGTADVIDAAVALAAGPGTILYTSDPGDLTKLLANLPFGQGVQVVTV